MADSATSVLPRMFGLTAQFYGWLAAGELRLQRCSECGVFRHVPRVLCPACASDRWDWQRSTGRGRVYSWTTTVRPLHPAFTETPVTLVVVALDEGPRILAQLVDVAEGQVEMGMPVEATFVTVSKDVAVVQFKPADESKRTAK